MWKYAYILLAAQLYGCSGNSSPAADADGGGGGGGGGSGGSGGGSSGGSNGDDADTSPGSSSGVEGGMSAHDGAATSSDAGGAVRDGGVIRSPDAGLHTYPPLKFADIGQAAKVSGQFYFTEGPVWDPVKGVLYFTDINAHQGAMTGGAVYKLTLPNTFEILLQPDGNADGLGLDPDGNIVAAGYGARSAWRLSGTTRSTLAACSGGAGTCYQGKEINTPDDITSRSDGVLYFTDPTFGQSLASGTFGLSGAQGVYRLTKDGVLHLEDSTTSGPNGVNLSPDEKTLYVAYTTGNSVSKFTVAADGSLSQKTPFASANLADSMCVDAGGNVYVATSGGLQVFDSGGHSLGTIAVGGDIVTNCAFGGADQKTLFITSHSTATLIGTPTMGSSSLYQVTGMPVPGIPGQN